MFFRFNFSLSCTNGHRDRYDGRHTSQKPPFVRQRRSDNTNGEFMNKTLSSSFVIALAVVGFTACAEDDKGSGAASSYCEALCDWAADCAGDALGKKEAKNRCLEAARAADSNCADAEAGDLNPAEQALQDSCIESFDDKSCDDITGSETDVASATPSSACVTSEGEAAVDAYNDGRAAAQPSGDELCDEIGTTICEQVVDCLTMGHADDVTEVGEVLQETCEATVTADMVANCKDVGLDVGYGTDTNANRIAADDCYAELGGLEDSCDIFSESAWPATCGGSVIAADELAGLAGSLVEFAAANGVDL